MQAERRYRLALFSDCGTPDDLPDNVQIVPISFVDYCQLVSERLGIPFKPANPYKLCDIKPALGHIHAEHLADVDFWGFSDIDLVYGQLRGYFSEERLARYDLLSTHARRVSGHLCLLRNNERMRQAFMRVPGWQACFEDPEHRAFDEAAFSRLFIRRKTGPRHFGGWPIASIRGVEAVNSTRRSARRMREFHGSAVASISRLLDMGRRAADQQPGWCTRLSLFPLHNVEERQVVRPFHGFADAAWGPCRSTILVHYRAGFRTPDGVFAATERGRVPMTHVDSEAITLEYSA